MKKYLIYIPMLMSIVFASCSHDNYDGPDSLLTGTITYDGASLGVKGGENELEIWQDGYALNTKVQVYIAQDGTFSASLFAGEYKLVRLGGAPWVDQSTDTIVVNVSGTSNIQVPVTPYLKVDDVSYSFNGGQLTATFTVNKVVEDAAIGSVHLFLGANYLVNNVNKDMDIVVDAASITYGEPTTVTVDVSDDLTSLNFFHARVGVNSNKSVRFIFSASEKINI